MASNTEGLKVHVFTQISVKHNKKFIYINLSPLQIRRIQEESGFFTYSECHKTKTL